MPPDALPIESVEWFVVEIPTSYRYSDRDGLESVPGTDYYFEHDWDQVYSTALESCLLRISTGDRHGWGEVQAPIVPEVAATLVDRLLGPMLLGEDAFRVEALRDRAYRSMNVRGHYQGFMLDAVAGLDAALWDLVGRAVGKPTGTLLGGRRRDRLPAYVSLPGFESDEQADQARGFVDDGFAGVKAFGGTGIEADVATVAAIREAVGPDPAVMLDAFWSYAPFEAIRLGERLADANPGFLEAPLAPEDVSGHARVVSDGSVPVAVGEPIRTTHEFRRWLEADALDVAQPDVMRTGLTEARRIADLAASHGRPVAPHFGSALGVGMAATWHLASAIPNFRVQEFQPRCFEATDELLDPGLSHEDGELLVPDGPGLGVEVDEDALAGYVVDSGVVEA